MTTLADLDKRKPIPARFANKVAIVTGGTAGIGLAIAQQLCHEGATVALSGLPADGEEAAGQLSQAGYPAACFLGDMSQESFCEQIVRGVLERFGRVDYLVNNAFSFVAESLDATRADWDRAFSVGPIAFAKMIQLVADPMEQQGGGAIVNLASISGHIAQKSRWTYNMAKGAVNQLTKCAALDLAPRGIRVNSISPAWIWTREVEKAAGGDRQKYEPIWGAYHMLGRLGRPVECAAATLFLLSDDARFITGTDLPVDGGYLSMGPEGLGQTAIIAGTK